MRSRRQILPTVSSFCPKQNWQCTHSFRSKCAPVSHLLPSHSGLFDGVFAGPLHRDTESVGLLPFSAAELAEAPSRQVRKEMRLYNRKQRRLRVVVEQTFALIKQWGIVGNNPWRGDLDDQGLNFLLATQLTTWLMVRRNAYPRGKKWRDEELEEWERRIQQWLEVDPLHPEIY